MKQKEDLSKILCILSRAFIGQKEEGATWAGEVASNAWLPHILALAGGDAFKGRPGLGVKRKFYVSKQLQNVTHATLTYAPSECGLWIGIWFAKRMPNKYVL